MSSSPGVSTRSSARRRLESSNLPPQVDSEGFQLVQRRRTTPHSIPAVVPVTGLARSQSTRLDRRRPRSPASVDADERGTSRRRPLVTSPPRVPVVTRSQASPPAPAPAARQHSDRFLALATSQAAFPRHRSTTSLSPAPISGSRGSHAGHRSFAAAVRNETAPSHDDLESITTPSQNGDDISAASEPLPQSTAPPAVAPQAPPSAHDRDPRRPVSSQPYTRPSARVLPSTPRPIPAPRLASSASPSERNLRNPTSVHNPAARSRFLRLAFDEVRGVYLTRRQHEFLDQMASDFIDPLNEDALAALGLHDSSVGIDYPHARLLEHLLHRLRSSSLSSTFRDSTSRDLSRLDALQVLSQRFASLNLALPAPDEMALYDLLWRHSSVINATYGSFQTRPLSDYTTTLRTDDQFAVHNRIAQFYDRPPLDASDTRAFPEVTNPNIARSYNTIIAPHTPPDMAIPPLAPAALQALQDRQSDRLATAAAEAIRQASLRDDLLAAGKSSVDIYAETPKAPGLVVLDEDGDPFVYDCTKENLEKRKGYSVVFRRFASDDLVARYVGPIFVFNVDLIRQDLSNDHQIRLFFEITGNPANLPPSVRSLPTHVTSQIPHLLLLPVVTSPKHFEQFVGYAPWNDLSLRHFVPPHAPWNSITSITEAINNLCALMTVVFGSHMDQLFASPLQDFRARCVSSHSIHQSPLVIPWAIDNLLRQFWSLSRHPYSDHSTGSVVRLKRGGWHAIWTQLLNSVSLDFQTLQLFKAQFEPALLARAATSVTDRRAVVFESAGSASRPSRPSTPTPSNRSVPSATTTGPSAPSTASIGPCLSQLLYAARVPNAKECKFGPKCKFGHAFSKFSRSTLLDRIDSDTRHHLLQDSSARSALKAAIETRGLGQA